MQHIFGKNPAFPLSLVLSVHISVFEKVGSAAALSQCFVLLKMAFKKKKKL